MCQATAYKRQTPLVAQSAPSGGLMMSILDADDLQVQATKQSVDVG
jgi:hypothetical protein